jgi:hypothetical protein
MMHDEGVKRGTPIMRYTAPEAATKFWVIQDMFRKGRKVVGIFAFNNAAQAQVMADDYAARYPMHGYTVQLGLG